MNDSTDNTPTLLAERTGEGQQVRVWCSHCRPHRRATRGTWHYHGAGGERGWLGRRDAHCLFNSGSPYLRTGYNLAIPGEAGIRG